MKNAIKSKIINMKLPLVFIHIYRAFEVLFCEQFAHKSKIFAFILLHPCKHVC